MSHYPNFDRQALLAQLPAEAGAECLDTAQGSVVLCRQGGRVLGLYPEKNGANVLWVNPELARCLREGDWFVGGERLWLAPERDFHYHQPASFEGYHVQASLDPAAYRRVASAHFSHHASLRDYQAQREFQAHFERRFGLIDDPFDTGLAYVGLAIEDSIQSPDLAKRFAAWSITQVYVKSPQACGTGAFPIGHNQARIVPFFGPLSAEYTALHADYARCRLDAQAFYKLAIRPEDQRADQATRALYLSPCPSGSQWFCVIKQAEHSPRRQAECVDIAKNPDEPDTGAVQAYNHITDPQAEHPHAFGEIELQLHAAEPSPGTSSACSRGTHRLLAYTGSQAQMLELAQHALASEQPPALY